MTFVEQENDDYVSSNVFNVSNSFSVWLIGVLLS